ncbi:DNA repair protein RadC [Frateuria sp. Soil773]|uniref:RadC family protein n=1 Tax=Frateuria sp. Soil773 TaxID=1736407 RepID=UPI0006F3FD22|nr:DNA repair protein RadC [Frateuria sp. Soil773]KRE89483.1 DNA repair protein RadC [Frateuria sp. Soil773]
MSHISSPSESSLLVRDARGRYIPATADQILSAARQVVDRKMQRGADFGSSADVKAYLRAKLAGLDHEVFAVLFLDNRHRLIEYVEMFRGTLDGAPVYPREVVKEALRLNAAAVILAHPHPSGNSQPSQADKMITRELREALALIGVRVLDHFVVAGNDAVSMAERGLL